MSYDRARTAVALFRLDRFSAAHAAWSSLVEKFKENREFGNLALAQLRIADCLIELNDLDAVPGVLMDALSNANRHGGDELIAHVEMRHADYLMSAGSLRDACELLNSLRRRRASWSNQADRLLHLNRLGHCYRLQHEYGYARSCFDRELEEAGHSECFAEALGRVEFGRATLVVDELWRRLIERICTTEHSDMGEMGANTAPDRLLDAMTSLKQSVTASEFDSGNLKALHLVSQRRLAVLFESEKGGLVDLPSEHFVDYSGHALGMAHMRHIDAVSHLLGGRPQRALKILQFLDTHGGGDLELDALAVSHRLATRAAEQAGQFKAALAHARNATKLAARIADLRGTPPEPPAFTALERDDRSAVGRKASLQGHAELVDRACRLIEIHLSNRISHSFLSTALGTSTRTLQLAFLSEVKSSPMQVLKRRRIERARQLMLTERHMSVRSIAEAVGMPRLGTFIATYRDAYGELPSVTMRRLD